MASSGRGPNEVEAAAPSSAVGRPGAPAVQAPRGRHVHFPPSLRRQTQSCTNLDYDFIFNSWDTLSASIADKIRSGSTRVDRLEFEVIQERDEPTAEKTPLVSKRQTPDYQSLELFKDDGTQQPGISWVAMAFGLANASVGVGILNYPFVYNRIGSIETATIMQICLILVLMLSMAVIIYCSDIDKSCSYHEVLSAMCGPKAKVIVGLDIAVATYGICIAYLVVIGDQYDRIFASLVGNDFCKFWYLDRRFTIALTGLFIYPICLLKKLDFLRHTGPLGIFSMLYVVFLAVYEHYKLDIPSANFVDTTSNKTPSTWFEILACVPVICFGYQCNEVIVPIYASLRDRKFVNFLKAAVVAWTVLVVLYCTVGTFGYMTFGSAVSPNVFTMFNASDPLVLIGVCALIFKMVVTYPQMAFAGREAFGALAKSCSTSSPEQFEKNEPRRRFRTTTFWFSTTLLVSAFAPHIGIVLELLGILAAFNVFICPALCLASLSRREDLGHRSSQRIVFAVTAIILTVLGVATLILVTVQVVLDIQLAINEGSKSLCVL